MPTSRTTTSPRCGVARGRNRRPLGGHTWRSKAEVGAVTRLLHTSLGCKRYRDATRPVAVMEAYGPH